MKAQNITERIREIKSLIARASYKTAFDQLEQLITEIDGIEVENDEEREFLNQLITIRARYNGLQNKVITGTDDEKQELNQIVKSLLQLTDNIHELLKDNPDLIIPQTDEITANLSIPINTPTATVPVIEVPATPSSGASNKGCLFSLSKTNDKTDVNIQANWLRFFTGAGIFILALALALGLGSILYSQLSSEKVDVEGNVEGNVKGNVEGNVEDSSATINNLPEIITHEHPAKAFTVEAPKNSSAAIKAMADHLSTKSGASARRFSLEQINFEKNSASLNAAAKAELDDLVVILKQIPDREINIMAGFSPNEKGSYRGSKEITLGDARAREIYNYLKYKGIPRRSMEFEGSGVKESEMVEIILEK